MRTIPEIRARLSELARIHGIAELHDLSLELARRPMNGPRAPSKSAPMTPTLRAEIRAWCKANPNAAQHEAATHFNVNPGRVSEALRGKR